MPALNEDIWPRVADPGPWLSRGMRLALGLEPPERRQGQAAHDFEMALGNAEVIDRLCRADRHLPGAASRLVQRLDAFIGEAAATHCAQRGGRWLAQAARASTTPAARDPAPRPAPKPPASIRPRQLSVTEIETLMRSPYDIYAKHVLRLRRARAARRRARAPASAAP